MVVREKEVMIYSIMLTPIPSPKIRNKNKNKNMK